MFGKIDINKVYIAEIWVVKNTYPVSGLKSVYDFEVQFIKTIVVKSINKNGRPGSNIYVNLLTGEKYYYGVTNCCSGDFFINKLTPYTDVISVEKDKISKKKVLQKYSGCKNKVKDKE